MIFENLSVRTNIRLIGIALGWMIGRAIVDFVNALPIGNDDATVMAFSGASLALAILAALSMKALDRRLSRADSI